MSVEGFEEEPPALPVRALDAGLELAILPSFSNLGFAIRSRLFGWREPAPAALAGRTALITGPTSGLGVATARELARAGARLILVSRDESKLEALRLELMALTGEDRYRVMPVDMSSLAAVRRAVREVSASEERLDVLIDNAGGMFDQRRESPDGIELTLALMVVGPFALISGLMPMLRRSDDARVVTVSSGGAYVQPVDFGDLEWRQREWSGPRAYAQAKRIQVGLVREWARRLRGSSVAYNAMHPGWVDTPGLEESLPAFYRLMKPLLRNAEQGADTMVWLALSPAVSPPGGRLYLDRRPRPYDRYPGTRLSAQDRAELWRVVAELAGAAEAG
jgi:dehydrogenase/reductase SDR family member 12